MQPKVVTVVGARPQFIKAAPVSAALRGRLDEVVVNTGQHYDFALSDLLFQQLDMKRPDYNLGIGSGPHGDQTSRMLSEIERVLLEEMPEWVLVYGDTNSTLAAALAAAKLHIPVAHVEAGLRSFNRRMPEEINRVVTDHVSTVLFAPTGAAVQHLRNEGLVQGVHEVGDVMYDALLLFKERAGQGQDLLAPYGVEAQEYYLATVHRADNTDSPERLRNILSGLATLSRPVILPLHPRTRERIQRWGMQDLLSGSIRQVDPLGYLEMLQLQSQCRAIFTDSGGIQKEAYLLRVPCVTLRDETEWTETVDAGWNVIAGCCFSEETIPVVSELTHPDLYGDGRASERIGTVLAQGVAAR